MFLPHGKIKMAAVNEGVWKPYKELLAVVESAIVRKRTEDFHDLDVALRKHRADFSSLLQNPSKNPVHREQIKKAPTEGVKVHSQTSKRILPESFVQEVLILSDILNLNEFSCIDLLFAGEHQQPNFPGLTRGLVAVLLYYDARRCIASTLRTLVQARQGLTWTMGISDEMTELITKYTSQFIEEGLTKKILSILEECTISRELHKLQQGKGIGNEKHQRQLTDFITESRQLLAETLFCWACQSPLPKRDCLQILDYLKKNASEEADGTVDNVTLALFMALLYSLNVDIIDDAVDLQTSLDVAVQSLPMLSDDTFIPEFHMQVQNLDQWTLPGLGAALLTAWSLVLCSLSQCADLVGAVDILEEDEGMMDLSQQYKAFQYLNVKIVKSANFHQEEYYVMKLHSLVTGFIVKMPLKLKELRNRGDEAARIIQAHLVEGIEPPQDLPKEFEDFLRLVGALYSKDPLGLELAAQFWCPPDPQLSPSSSRAYNLSYRQVVAQKQISLFKFVRIAGDLLPASLFVPYVHMLCGLSTGQTCAHQCFNLLKSNGSSVGGSTVVSWDHFFHSIKQYYLDLRHETQTPDTGYHSSMSHRGITPHELTGLEAVLALTHKVADQDEFARIAFCENQTWLPIASLFGLVGCVVQSSLKAHLVKTLAALARSPEIAAPMWHSLEIAQILQTVKPSGQTLHEGGIEVELNEIEARNEAYPETRAFIELIGTLTEVTIPPSLGAGYRVPGFEPYLVFLRDSVFLKFNSRAYQDAGEKWQVASGVVKILFKLLANYEPKIEDLVEQTVEAPGGTHSLAPKPPGLSLMIHMMNDSDMLRMILSIIDEASQTLDQLHSTSVIKEHLEETAYLCLRIVEVTLEKQSSLLELIRDHGCSVMVTPLDHLLMSVNVRTGAVDFLLKIARYLTLSHTEPQLSLSAVKILCLVCQSPLIQPKIVNILTTNKTESLEILMGFVDHLEINEPEVAEEQKKDLTQELYDTKVFDASQINNATRQNILRLLLCCLDHPSPNLSHFLLGFEIRKPVGKTNLQDPGVLGSPKTCLHAILDVLNKGVGSHNGPACVTETPCFSELAYKLIYKLCANKDTSMPTVRYLCSSHDFLYQHLQHLPFLAADEMSSSEKLHLMNQQAWLLKSSSIELRLTALNKQRSHTQRLLGLLLSRPTLGGNESLSRRSLNEIDSSRIESSFSDPTFVQEMHAGHSRRKILSLLDSLDFMQEFPPELQLNYFDVVMTERVIASCERTDMDTGVVYCNVKMLHKLVMTELNSIQGTASVAQKNLLLQEVQAILVNAVERNSVRQNLYGKKQAFDAWRQVLEVILATCPLELLQGETRQMVILEILQDLLVKIASESALPELTSPVAGVILSLMTHLRQCTLPSEDAPQLIPLLDNTSAGQVMEVLRGSHALPQGPMQSILKGIIEAILRSGGCLQRVRANLYGALLYYLQIAQKMSEEEDKNGVGNSVLSGHGGETWRIGTLSILNSYGEMLMEAVCRDACDGHDVGRMLAFSLLDIITSLDWQQVWLRYLSMKGYLRHFIEGLIKDDEGLQTMLEPVPQPLRVLYIYESKMALLTRIAQTSHGAEALLQSGVFARLSECQFLELRPDSEVTRTDYEPHDTHYDTFVPSVMDRYRQILVPTLKLVLAILTSLGPQHQEGTNQVMHFAVCHVDVFCSILQDRQTVHSQASLDELALVTGVVSGCAVTSCDSSSSEEEEILVQDQFKLKGPLARIQRHMLALLPKYCTSNSWEKVVKSHFLEDGESNINLNNDLQSIKLHQTLIQTVTNLISYCKTLISTTVSSSQKKRILFAPNMADLMTRVRDIRHSSREVSQSLSISSHPPALGVLVCLIKDCTKRIETTEESHQQLTRKLSIINELSSDDIKELLPRAAMDKLSTQQKQQLAQSTLHNLIKHKRQEIDSLLFIIETSLYVLWRHLEFYYLKCLPNEQVLSISQLSEIGTSRARRLNDVSTSSMVSHHSLNRGVITPLSITDGISREEIDQLKAESAACLTDLLFKKIVQIEQSYSKKQGGLGFVDALVRRIRKLLTLHGVS